MIGPELGVTQPGMTIVCGDSHTATHGAFGALAFGIGTSEVEHVLATQCLVQHKPKSMRINYVGELGKGVTAKDLILYTIGQMGVDGANGHVVEYAGAAIEKLSMEGRMTVCNMTIEGGGRAGMIAPDETTFEYVIGRPGAPAEVPADWRELYTEEGAHFDTEITIDCAKISPMVTWGTNPGMVVGVADRVPQPAGEQDERALEYMGLDGGIPVRGDQARPCVHRVVHQFTDRRSTGGGGGHRRPQGRRRRLRDGRAGLGAGQGTGRGGRPGQGLPRGRIRLARGRLLDVSGHEPGHRGPGRARRLDLEPQLRGTAGPRRAHASGLAADGRSRGDRRPLRRHSELVHAATPAT